MVITGRRTSTRTEHVYAPPPKEIKDGHSLDNPEVYVRERPFGDGKAWIVNFQDEVRRLIAGSQFELKRSIYPEPLTA